MMCSVIYFILYRFKLALVYIEPVIPNLFDQADWRAALIFVTEQAGLVFHDFISYFISYFAVHGVGVERVNHLLP